MNNSRNSCRRVVCRIKIYSVAHFDIILLQTRSVRLLDDKLQYQSHTLLTFSIITTPKVDIKSQWFDITI